MSNYFFVSLVHKLIFFTFLVRSLKGENDSTKMVQTAPDNVYQQLVKTCCAHGEVFDVIANSCVSLTNRDLSNVLINYPLYQELGISKKNIPANFSHMKQECGLEEYKIERSPKNPMYPNSLPKIIFKDDKLEEFDSRDDHLRVEYLSSYCIDRAVNTSITSEQSYLGVAVIKCLPNYELRGTYVRLCCKLTEKYDEESNKCYRNIETPDAFTILDNVDRHQSKEKDKADADIDVINFLYNPPNCASGQIIKSSRETLMLYDNDYIKIGQSYFHHAEYCVTNVRLDASKSYSENTALVRYCEYLWRDTVVMIFVTPTLYIISDIFLLALFAYTVMENGHKLFGAMTLSIILNLFVCYLSTTIAKLTAAGQHRRIKAGTQNPSCFAGAFVMQFSYLSVVFWLNAMCFDVWANFHSMRVREQLSVQQYGKLRGFKHPKFKWYALYGWGIPFVVTIVTIMIQFLPTEYTEPLITPGIGEENCFLRSGLASLFYCYIIAGTGYLSSIVLFGLFVWDLCFGVWAQQTGDPVLR